MLSPNQIIEILITLLALGGFILSFTIRRKKSAKKKLVCPKNPRIDCDTVIHSDYSTLIGIPVEMLGMLYYGLVALLHTQVLTRISLSQTLPEYRLEMLFGVSLCAVLFSIYLVSVQAFVIRHWCLWCLGSAFISIAIAALSYCTLGLAL